MVASHVLSQGVEELVLVDVDVDEVLMHESHMTGHSSFAAAATAGTTWLHKDWSSHFDGSIKPLHELVVVVVVVTEVVEVEEDVQTLHIFGHNVFK